MDEESKRRPGAAKGNQNAVKHGRRSAEMVALKRRLRAYLRRIKPVPQLARRVKRAKSAAEAAEALAAIRAIARGDTPLAQKPLKIDEQLSCATSARP